jgi:membrane fusion protein, multidrug efflux system
VLWGVALLALVGLLAWLLREPRGEARVISPAPVKVVTAAAQRANLPVYLDALGTVTPLHTVSLTSQVNGQVTAVHYEEGQVVQQGMALIDIDARPFEATLLQAQGILERDTQLLAQSRMDLERYRAAWAKNAISRQQLEDQEKLVLQNEGIVKNDRGSVAFDQTQLAFCHITAPITGRIGLRLVDPGNVLTAAGGTVLAVITELQPISVVFTLAEDELGGVLEQTRQGARLSVEARDRSKSKVLASGTLLALDNQIDTTTGTVKARALFDNRDEALFPNQFVNTRLLVRTIADATTLPTSALQHDGKDTFVYVIQDARAHLQHVATGVIDGDTAQVEGIAAGTLVANSSFEKLSEGAAVAPSGPSAAKPSPAAGGAAP